MAEKTYLFKVNLKYAPAIWRTIEMRGDQTLHDLHRAIFYAFDRYDEHMYSFFMSGKAWDSESEYSSPYAEEGEDASDTTIDSLRLNPRKKFLYLFDYGDEWQHVVQFLKSGTIEPGVEYPRIIESHGDSPPQYPPDEEEEYEDEEAEEREEAT